MKFEGQSDGVAGRVELPAEVDLRIRPSVSSNPGRPASTDFGVKKASPPVRWRRSQHVQENHLEQLRRGGVGRGTTRRVDDEGWLAWVGPRRGRFGKLLSSCRRAFIAFRRACGWPSQRETMRGGRLTTYTTSLCLQSVSCNDMPGTSEFLPADLRFDRGRKRDRQRDGCPPTLTPPPRSSSFLFFLSSSLSSHQLQQSMQGSYHAPTSSQTPGIAHK